MLKQYEYAHDVLYLMRTGGIPEEEKERALQWLILRDSWSAYKVIEYKLYDNDEQLQQAINKALREPNVAFQLISKINGIFFGKESEEEKERVKSNLDVLSFSQKKVALKISLEDNEYILKILNNPILRSLLSSDEINEALETILLEKQSIINALNAENIILYDKKVIIDNIKDNKLLLKEYFKTNKNSRYLNLPDMDRPNKIIRKIAFDSFLELSEIKEIFELAQDKYFREEELEQIYLKYHLALYDLLKLKFQDYYIFCSLFDKWLDEKYRTRLAKKLMTKTHWHKNKRVRRAINFSESDLKLLENYAIIDKLNNPNSNYY